MTINEFVSTLKERTDDIDLQTILEIRAYIPIAEKRAILETVLSECFTVEDGMLTCDYVLRHIAFDLAMIKYHTNLDIDITSEEDYDAIKQTGIDIHWGYEADYKICKLLFDEMEKSLRDQYSVESTIVCLSNTLSNSVTTLVNTITNKINDLDMSKFGFEDLEIDKLKDLLVKHGNKV